MNNQQQIKKMKDQAEEQAHSAMGWAHKKLDQVQDKARGVLDDTVERLTPIDRWLRSSTRNRPLLMLGGAVGVGLLAGLLLSLGRKSD